MYFNLVSVLRTRFREHYDSLKLRVINNIRCTVGGHDYEVKSVDLHRGNVTLVCFCCGHEKGCGYQPRSAGKE